MVPLNQQDYNKYYQMFKGDFYKGFSVFKSLVDTPSIAENLIVNDAAVAAVFTDYKRSKVDGMCKEYLIKKPYAATAVLTYTNQLNDTNWTLESVAADADTLLKCLADPRVGELWAEGGSQCFAKAPEDAVLKCLQGLLYLDTAKYTTLASCAADKEVDKRILQNPITCSLVLASQYSATFFNASQFKDALKTDEASRKSFIQQAAAQDALCKNQEAFYDLLSTPIVFFDFMYADLLDTLPESTYCWLVCKAAGTSGLTNYGALFKNSTIQARLKDNTRVIAQVWCSRPALRVLTSVTAAWDAWRNSGYTYTAYAQGYMCGYPENISSPMSDGRCYERYAKLLIKFTYFLAMFTQHKQYSDSCYGNWSSITEWLKKNRADLRTQFEWPIQQIDQLGSRRIGINYYPEHLITTAPFLMSEVTQNMLGDDSGQWYMAVRMQYHSNNTSMNRTNLTYPKYGQTPTWYNGNPGWLFRRRWAFYFQYQNDVNYQTYTSGKVVMRGFFLDDTI